MKLLVLLLVFLTASAADQGQTATGADLKKDNDQKESYDTKSSSTGCIPHSFRMPGPRIFWRSAPPEKISSFGNELTEVQIAGLLQFYKKKME